MLLPFLKNSNTMSVLLLTVIVFTMTFREAELSFFLVDVLLSCFNRVKCNYLSTNADDGWFYTHTGTPNDKKLKACFLTEFEIEKENLIQNNITTDTIDCFIRKPILLSIFIKKVIVFLKQSSTKKLSMRISEKSLRFRLG